MSSSIVNVAPSNTVYEADVRLQDQAGNRTEYPVNYRVIDTQRRQEVSEEPGLF